MELHHLPGQLTVPHAEQAIRFVLDGRVIEEANAAPTTTVLQYLRESLGRTGTKEGCAEGDCGACTVVLGELESPGVRYRAINSCIRFLPTIDGKELVTVESLQPKGAPLHPVQQALVDCHASQCGFCTPGFVMSLFALYLGGGKPAPETVVHALSGNLCRCTGYRPIIEAGCRMHEYPQPPRWSAKDAASGERVARLRSIQREVPLEIASTPPYVAPRSVDELARLYEAAPASLLVAGATDVGLWVTKELRDLPAMIYLGDVGELKQVRDADGALEIGAAVSLADGYAALVRRYPMLAEMAERFASPPVRHSGTLVGNLANGSPIGDSMPILIALGATLKLRRGKRIRSMPLEDLYLGYRKTALESAEFIAAVSIPKPVPGRLVATYKVSKRIDQDISAVCAAFAIDVHEGAVRTARIAFGGMAATPKRAAHLEAALTGQSWSLATVESAMPALEKDFQPITDMRASGTYRARVAANLLKRFYLEQAGGVAPLRVEALGAQ
jgi:xanthine dehydrogenase small subunit